MKILDHLLKHTSTAYTLVNKKLQIISYNTAFQDICQTRSNLEMRLLTDLVVEFIGMESVLTAILASGDGRIELPFINKKDSVYRCIAERVTEETMLVSFTDQTEKALLKQRIVQKENEIKILKSRLKTQNSLAETNLIGESSALLSVKKRIARVAQIPSSSILLEGETGTGKSMTARVIHSSSPRKEKPFVEINCAAIPENLLEAELFGSVKGAFTHALSDRRGLIESANGGTLFLDEISELPLSLQSKLLSFLETRRFRPLGSNTEKKVTVQVITATNKNLQISVQKNEFREDLYYRLSVVPIKLPPLKEMESDTLLLAKHFIEIYNLAFNKKVTGLSEKAQNKLLNYNWPGNVRELSNTIEQAMIFSDGTLLDADDIFLRDVLSTTTVNDLALPESGIQLEELEVRLIKEALAKCKGNKTKAGKMLGLSRDTFRYRLEKYNITVE